MKIVNFAFLSLLEFFPPVVYRFPFVRDLLYRPACRNPLSPSEVISYAVGKFHSTYICLEEILASALTLQELNEYSI